MTPPNDLYDPRTGDQALRSRSVSFAEPYEPPRSNLFAIQWIREGTGMFSADSAHHEFRPSLLLFFKPYQYIRFEPRSPVAAEVLQFHANFLCVETFHAEVGCAGVLFNDPYGAPIVALDDATTAEMIALVDRIRRELGDSDLARDEMLLAYMKVILILSTRLKSQRSAASCMDAIPAQDEVLDALSQLIEQNYHTLHQPSDYARLLHRTPKTLGRLVRDRLGKTLGDLIRERILTHAKWQLLHTLKPIKEIAREVGFRDELYFSRLFKKATGFSPRQFRQFETEIRGGSNLSMFWGEASIPPPGRSSDNSIIQEEISGSRRRRRASKPRDKNG